MCTRVRVVHVFVYKDDVRLEREHHFVGRLKCLDTRKESPERFKLEDKFIFCLSQKATARIDLKGSGQNHLQQKID